MGHKNKKGQLRSGRLINSALLLLLAANANASETALDCSNIQVWDPQATYNTGDKVQQDNNGYQAKWWTQSNPALKSGDWDEWSKLGSCATRGQNLPPIVALLQPSDGFQLQQNDSAVVTAQASDNDGTIARVVFYENGTPIATDSSAPYSVNWSPTTKGQYQLSAEATDNLGSKSISEMVNVTVIETSTPNVAPTAVLSTSSLNQIYVGEAIDFNLAGNDSDGQVTSLDLLANDISIFKTKNDNTSFRWTPVEAGTYNLKLVATDNDQATGSSNTLTV